MKEPTKRQEEVLDFISRYVNTHAYPPTIREVAEFFCISVKGAHDHLTALKKKGFLKQGDKKSRTIELVKNEEEAEQEDVEEIPILGTVAAGRPILSDENLDGYVRLHRSFLKKDKSYFALRIRGDSMENAGIMDGDTAIIEQQNVVKNGDIAVAMLDDGVTIKTFYRESTRIKLQPENAKYTPIFCSQDLRILGRLALVFRSYESAPFQRI